jgi:hypothetical protein
LHIELPDGQFISMGASAISFLIQLSDCRIARPKHVEVLPVVLVRFHQPGALEKRLREAAHYS